MEIFYFSIHIFSFSSFPSTLILFSFLLSSYSHPLFFLCSRFANHTSVLCPQGTFACSGMGLVNVTFSSMIFKRGPRSLGPSSGTSCVGIHGVRLRYPDFHKTYSKLYYLSLLTWGCRVANPHPHVNVSRGYLAWWSAIGERSSFSQ